MLPYMYSRGNCREMPGCLLHVHFWPPSPKPDKQAYDMYRTHALWKSALLLFQHLHLLTTLCTTLCWNPFQSHEVNNHSAIHISELGDGTL